MFLLQARKNPPNKSIGTESIIDETRREEDIEEDLRSDDDTKSMSSTSTPLLDQNNFSYSAAN